MEIAEVIDRRSLEAYLNGLLGNQGVLTARRVAFLAAARVAPFAFSFLAQTRNVPGAGLTPLPVFLALSIGSVNAASVSSAIRPSVSANAASAARAAGRAAGSATYAARAARAAGAVADGNTSRADANIARATFAVSAVDLADFVAPEFWEIVRHDLRVQSSDSFRHLYLWPKGEMPDEIASVWSNAREFMLNDASGTNWRFWITWYERMLAGKDIHADMMAPILNELTKENWPGDLAKLTPQLVDALAVYEAEDVDALAAATPIGETVAFDRASNTFNLVPTDQIAASYIADIRGQIESAIKVLDLNGVGGNAYGALRKELEILGDAQTIHHDRPVLILKDVSRVLKRLARKIDGKECPSAAEDENIEDFQEILTDVQGELIGFNSEVQAYFKASRPAVDEQRKQKFIDGAHALTPASGVELAVALNNSVSVLSDDNSDEEAKRDEQFRIIGLLVRARKSLKQTSDLVKDASVVGGAVAAGGGAIAWLYSPAFREFVEAAMKVMIP